MPEFEFHFSCADGEITCKKVQDEMINFKNIVPIKNNLQYDHKGTIVLPNMKEAFIEQSRLEKKLGKNILSIKIKSV